MTGGMNDLGEMNRDNILHDHLFLRLLTMESLLLGLMEMSGEAMDQPAISIDVLFIRKW